MENSETARSDSLLTNSQKFYQLPQLSQIVKAHPLQIVIFQAIALFIFLTPLFVNIKQIADTLNAQLYIFFAILIAIVFSGAHLNPIVTLSILFRKQLKISIKQIPFHFLGQLIGIILAVAYCYFYTHELIYLKDNKTISQNFQAGIGQMIGVFVLILAILVITNPNMNTTTEQVDCLLIICSGVLVGRLITPQSGQYINPSIVIVLSICSMINGKEFPLNMIGYILGDMIGLILGLVMYELLKKESKQQKMYLIQSQSNEYQN